MAAPKPVLTQLLALVAAIATTAGCGMQQIPNQAGYDTNFGPSMVRQQTMPTLPPGVQPRSIALQPAQTVGRVGETMRFAVSIKGSDGKVYSDSRLALWTLSNPQGGNVDVNDRPAIEEGFQISKAFPNPFNPSTTVSFSTPRASMASVTVYNTLGQQVTELFNGNLSAGTHDVVLDGSQLSSGIYFVQLVADNQVRDLVKVPLVK